MKKRILVTELRRVADAIERANHEKHLEDGITWVVWCPLCLRAYPTQPRSMTADEEHPSRNTEPHPDTAR